MKTFIRLKNCYLDKIESNTWIENRLEWGQSINVILTSISLRFTNGDKASAVFESMEMTDLLEFFLEHDYSNKSSREIYDMMCDSFTKCSDETYSKFFFYKYV